MTLLRQPTLHLLAEWERAHQRALLAESSLGRRRSTCEAAVMARELRAVADRLFEDLLERNAFGWLDPMPGRSYRSRAAELLLVPTSPAPL